MKKKLFIGVYNPSIILTYISVFCSIVGLGFLATYSESTSLNVISLCMILLAVAGVCDMFDGKVARMCKRTEKEKEFGIQLDSLADTVSFVVFPATLLMFVCNFTIFSIVVAMFYVFTGIMRLGWFNITTEENKGFFQGLPVTMSALIFPTCYFVLRYLDKVMGNGLFIGLYLAVATLFILNFKMKKPSLKVSLGLLGLAFVVIALFLIF